MTTGCDIQIRVLGRAEVTINGQEIDLPRRKERAVLAALALRAGRQVAIHEIEGALWGEPAPATARKSLQMHVSRLRSHLQCPDLDSRILSTVESGYLLRVDPANVDALRFECLIQAGRQALEAGSPVDAGRHLDEAVALWRSDPLPELADTPNGDAEIARFRELRRVAIEDRNEVELALGHHGLLIGTIEAQLAEEPLRERLWGQLMIALYRSGRQADALRAYQRARTILVDELGLEPAPELRALEAAVVQQDPELAAPPSHGSQRGDRDDPDPAAGPPAAPEPPHGVTAPLAWIERTCTGPFVNRSDESAQLDQAFLEAQSGLQVIAVSGDDGIGKTRLVAEAAQRFVDKGALVLGGRCHGPHSPGAVFRQMITGWAERRDALPDDWPASTKRALASVSPTVADWLGTEGSGPLEPYLLASTLAWFVEHQRRNLPGVLVIDDLHVTGPYTLETIRCLLEGHGAVPLLVVLVFRGTQTHGRPELLDLLDDLHRLPSYRRLALGPLDPTAAADLMATSLDDVDSPGWRAALEQLGEDLGGRPRFLQAVAGDLAARRAREPEGWIPRDLVDLGLPPCLHDQIRRRLRTLEPAHQGVLLASAAVGRRFDLDIVGRVTGTGDDDVLLAAVERGRAAGLVRELSPGRFEFGSTVVWAAIRAELSPSRLARLSDRITLAS